jgi:arginine utilization protein RocB
MNNFNSKMSEEFREALTSLTLELVRIRSVNGIDLEGETAVASRIHGEATKLGLESLVIKIVLNICS